MLGVNIGAGGGKKGRHGWEYVYPTKEEMRVAEGADVLRIGFKADNVRSSGGMDAVKQYLWPVITHALARGQSVILDRHDYGRTSDRFLTLDDVPACLDLWQSILAPFSRLTSRVMVGLMNEPKMSDDRLTSLPLIWAYNQAMITGLRRRKLRHMILLPTWNWQHAKDIEKNASYIQEITDPAANHLIDIHNYFDQYGSGQGADIRFEYLERISSACVVARQLGKKLAWTETGLPVSDDGHRLIDEIKALYRANKDVLTLITAYTLSAWMPHPHYHYGLCEMRLAPTRTLERWLA